MVACVEDDAMPPPELATAWACKRWNTLPEAGAYYDQDAALMTRMTKVLNVYNALSRLRNLKGKNIHQLTENERKILRVLVDAGLLFNV